MLGIKKENIDELFSAFSDIDSLIYFLLLLENDKNGEIICDEEFINTRKSAEFYLTENLMKAVSKMRSIINKEDFLNIIKKHGKNRVISMIYNLNSQIFSQQYAQHIHNSKS